MKYRKFLLLAMFILPWFSLPLVGLNTIKRFLPATIFISIVSKVIHLIAKRRRWWRFETRINSEISGSTAFILGPEFLASLWSLKWTYGKFCFFMITNAIAHFLFAFPGMKLFKRFDIVSYNRLSPIQLVFLFQIRALLLYCFQLIYEERLKSRS